MPKLSAAASEGGVGFPPGFEPIVRKHMIRRFTNGQDVSGRKLEALLRVVPWRVYLGLLCFIVLPMIPIGIGLMIAHRRASRANEAKLGKQRPILMTLSRGRLRMAWPVMFNGAFLSGGAAEGAGLVLACVDDGPEPANEHMAEIVRRMQASRKVAAGPLDRRLAEMMADDRFHPFRRRPIPEPLARGRAIYAFDLSIGRDELVADLRELPWIPCLVQPGKQGGILVVHGDALRAAEAEHQSSDPLAVAEAVAAAAPDATAATQTALMTLVMRKESAFLQGLAQESHAIDINDASMGAPMLSLAIANDLDRAAAAILQCKPDLAATDREFGMTPLVLAITKGKADLVRRIIAAGANVNATFGPAGGARRACLAAAVKGSDLAIVRMLLEAGAKPDCDLQPDAAAEEDRDLTPLAYAASVGDVELMRLMIEHGANVNHWPKSTVSPLMHACFNGQVEAAKLLVEKGAVIELASETLNTHAFEVALKRGHRELAGWLWERSKILQSGYGREVWAG